MTRKGRGAAGLAGLSAAALLAACAGPHRPPPPLIAAPAACNDFTVPIYFQRLSATVTRQAAVLLDDAARRAHRCAVTGVAVIGLADSHGGAEANAVLSRRRADAVAAALRARGLSGIDFQVGGAGAAGAVDAAGDLNPLRRRADVVFHLAPRASP